MLDAIRRSNTEFYRAFESLSIETMEAVWSHADDVRCVHPGWKDLVGWAAIHESWKAIFQSMSYMELNITDLQVWASGDLACVACHENIVTFRDGQEVRTVVLATNVFRREEGLWRMVLHHGSPVLVERPEE